MAKHIKPYLFAYSYFLFLVFACLNSCYIYSIPVYIRLLKLFPSSVMDVKSNITTFEAGIGKHPEWELEKTIDSNEFSEWLSKNLNLGLGFSLLYMTAVFAGKKYMEDKPRFNLKKSMMIWSLMLAVFSIIGSIRSAIVMYYLYQENGTRSVICSPQFYNGPITRFWGPVFVTSKILEYMDTAFIILRKQRLIFLHWYHHLTVSLFSWWTYGAQYAGGGVFMTVNFIVHAMMYSYYALKAANVKIPRPIAILITSSQIVQMLIGCWTIYIINEWRDVSECRSSWELVFYGGVMYGSYFVLFVHFFCSAYLSKPTTTKSKQQPSSSAESKEKKVRINDVHDEQTSWNGKVEAKQESKTSVLSHTLRERKSRK